MRDLVQLLRVRSQQQNPQAGYVFLRDGELEEAVLSHADLDAQARAIGAALQDLDLDAGTAGERALLLFPAGLDFVAAFFGCLYAGVVAVPSYPPGPAGLRRPQPRLRAIARDCRPRIVLTTAAQAARREELEAQVPELRGAAWIAADALPDSLAAEWRETAPGGDALAFLQYTSGSTSDPKGVRVTHGNLLHNEELIRQAFAQSEESVIAGWLPLYHDMGLIGNVLQPLYAGARCVLMSPLAFLQQPGRWLRAIDRYRATTSGGPNFAFDLCARRAAALAPELDLSSWILAFNGAEPVRAETLERFAAAFAPSGFRREAFYPCYGLAEATLFVAGGRAGTGVAAAGFEARALEENRAVEAAPGADVAGVRTLVSCGTAWGWQRIRIADPETGAALPEGRVGEIWVSGPSVAGGYWERPEDTARLFGARAADGSDGEGPPFLRTGDLGFQRGGELFVAGRLKDLLILRGRNHHPQDLELTAEASHPAIKPGGVAVFAAEAEVEERAVLVAEVDRHAREGAEEIAAAVRQAVAEAHEVQVWEVVLIRAWTLPKTSSGKVRRAACRAAWQDGSLEVVGRSRAGMEAERVGPDPGDLSPLLDELRRAVARACRVAPEAVPLNRPLTGLGLDSLAAVEVQQAVDAAFGVRVSLAELLRGASLEEIAAEVERAGEGAAAPGGGGEEGGAGFPLSWGQRALWFLDRLSPESAAYNIAAAARVRGPLDREALARALAKLTVRQPALRTVFRTVDDQPRQEVLPEVAVESFLAVLDAARWSEEERRERLDAEARRPFDLETGPPFRVVLLARSAGEHDLLLAIHHLVSDFWSVVVILAELEGLYGERLSAAASPPGVETGFPPCRGPAAALPAPYAAFVQWQQTLLASPRGARLQEYWERQLAGPLPQLELPTDWPRPAVQTYRGESVPLRLDAATAADLGTLCRERGATLFMGLAAAFQTLLHRQAGQREVLVGTPTGGRGAAAWAGQVGYFVNPVVLRADLGDSPGFGALLERTRSTVLAAFEHQDYPFALLAERLEGERDPSRSPVFQAMLILQKAQRPELEQLAGFALGEGGARTSWAGLELESLRLGRRPAQFDVTLSLALRGEEIAGSLQVNADLFDTATAHRMAGAFAALVRELAAVPQASIAEASLLGEAETAQILREWNDTEVAAPGEVWIHRAIDRQAAAAPDAVAVAWRDESLTYRELAERSNRLARHLLALGVEPEARVGVFLERSPDLLVALLGILKAGAAYVPLDPAYPKERLDFIVRDAGIDVRVDRETLGEIGTHSAEPLPVPDRADGLAYLIYTSGSTGTPKGVMVSHGNVANFFAGMDRCLGHGPDAAPGCWLAVTSISFDISVLELLWTLSRGFQVVLQAPVEERPAAIPSPKRPLDFSLFYFASDAAQGGPKYRLLLEGAKFADRNGFSAVWTPERHFHAFGGLYPNPAVTGAALAAVTERVAIRAGSVVLPLHHPVRVAEEWAVVDNLSNGRVGISFASGWNAADFLFAPDRYATRKQDLAGQIDRVRRLWRGEGARFPDGAGQEVEVRILPRPVQPELPFWLTAAASPDTFRLAGEMGANLLTHLLGQSVRDLAERIAIYREAWQASGHPGTGHVSLMLHTFVGDDAAQVREVVRQPFTDYLASSLDLMKVMAPGQDLAGFTDSDREALLARAFDRYFETSGLFGTPEYAARRAAELQAVGVDEIACLVDFGVDADAVLASLEPLARVAAACRSTAVEGAAPVAGAAAPAVLESLPSLILRHGVTHLQCTPSAATALLADPEAPAALGRLKLMMAGGEALSPVLAERLKTCLGEAPLLNMYGPTETTIWSAVGEVRPEEGALTLGRPIANTEIRLVDGHGQPVPVGRPGELWIGGDGVVRGYWQRPDLTAERFVPDPWAERSGGRLYRTGDLSRWSADGRPVFLGRLDHQVKVRGHRIELGEIEAVLARHPAVREAVVTVREDVPGDQRLVAYLVAEGGGESLAGRATPERLLSALDGHARHRLPNGMTVAHLSAEQTSAIYGEVFEQEIYLKHGVVLPEDACIFDVGANIGMFTLFAAARAPRARIFSFEPIPATYSVLSANVELYGLEARAFPFGVSDREEEADFTFYPTMAGLSGRFAADDQEVTAAIVKSWLGRTGKADAAGAPGAAEVDDAVREMLRAETHRCRLRPLSALIRELGVEHIDLLKVDVEKSEVRVLEGIADEDWPRIRQIVLEVHSRELLAACQAILATRGYQMGVDEFIPTGEWGEAVWMVYARQPGLRLAEPRPMLAVAEVRAWAQEKLPGFMVPAAYVVLDALPLTPNNKVDRKALPAPEGRKAAGVEKVYVAPETETQRAVAGVWRELLRVDEIGIHDNFFEVGGNSLLLVEAHGKLRRALGREVTLVELMRHPTIDSLSRYLGQAPDGGTAAGEAAEAARPQERGKNQREAFNRQRALAARGRQRPS